MRAASPRTLVLAGLLVAGAAAAEPPIGHLDGTGWPWGDPPGAGLICEETPTFPGMVTCSPQLRQDVGGIQCDLVYDLFDDALFSVMCLTPDSTRRIKRIMRPWVTSPAARDDPDQELFVSWWPSEAGGYQARVLWWCPRFGPEREELPEFIQEHLRRMDGED